MFHITLASILPDKAQLWFVGAPSNKLNDITHTLNLRNPDKDPVFVNIQLWKILNPATSFQQRSLIRNTGQQNMFVINPEKIIIPPKSFRTVAVIFTDTKSVTEEQVYYLTLKQVVSKKLHSNVNKNQKKAGIHLHFIINPIIHVLPLHPHISYTITKNRQTIKIKNTGNVHINLKFCTIQLCKNNKNYSFQNLYPHQMLTFILTSPKKYKKTNSINKSRHIIYNTTLSLNITKSSHIHHISFAEHTYNISNNHRDGTIMMSP